MISAALMLASCGENVKNAEKEAINVNGVDFTMVFVKGGLHKDTGCLTEKPDSIGEYTITIKDFYIGETEVTQALWKSVMGNNPSHFKGDDLPVENVSWFDAESFISKLNLLTGRDFYLPTKDEWKYAAQGGVKSKGYVFYGSNTPDSVAWYLDNAGGTTHAVKTKSPNELGLYDMTGNVREMSFNKEHWCQVEGGSWSAETNSYSPMRDEFGELVLDKDGKIVFDTVARADIGSGGGSPNAYYDKDNRTGFRIAMRP